MTALVVGFGVTGRAVARALVGRGRPALVVTDWPGLTDAAEAAAIGVELVVGPDECLSRKLVDAVDLVVPSPGVPVGHPLLALAAAKGVPVLSEVELGYRLLRAEAAVPPRLVAVTGTNGKTTVVTAVTDALTRSGLRAVAAGNIGLPVVAIDPADPPDVAVVEVSSFQLQFTDTFRPQVSCWLNLAADHLDWHPDLGHYRAAKARIWARQGSGDTAVVNADDGEVMDAAAAIPLGVQTVTFSATSPAAWTAGGGRITGPGGLDLLGIDELPRRLPHDVANAVATAAVTVAAGGSPAGVADALRHASPLAHRVALVGEGNGVAWYDDSKATTPASVAAATAGFASVVLIAGGRNKGLDLTPLGATAPPVRAVVAIGEAGSEVAAAFAGRADVVAADSMAEAVEAAAGLAAPGDAVILSPGCASFDWYGSYGERGDDFAALVLAHLQKGEPTW